MGISPQTKSFNSADLNLVDPAPRCAPPLAIGDRVQLRSGGPDMLIVDMGDESAVASYREGLATVEETFPKRCLRPVPAFAT